MKVALDTNVISQYLAGKPSVVEDVNKLGGIYLPYFVVSELLAGYEGGKRARESHAVLKEFLAQEGVIQLNSPDEATRELFSRIYGQLKKVGKMVSLMDIWISAECILAGTELFSYDKDIDRIPQVIKYRY